MGTLRELQTREPYFLPGYTGFCPQFRYRVGHTYGTQSHKLLLDPCVNHSERLVLSDRAADDYQSVRPPHSAVELVQARYQHGDPIYKHPMIPGYEGFVPREQQVLGQRFTVSATEALSQFEREQQQDRGAMNQLEKVTRLQAGRYCPRTPADRQALGTRRRLPLALVRPEMLGVVRCVPVPEPCLRPPPHSASPYFADYCDPEKFIKSGACVWVPFGYPRCGETHLPYTNSALCEFTQHYRRRRSTEWAPVALRAPDPPLTMPPYTIYHHNLGMVPHYLGHIPGAKLRHGKTYGADTQDAKRWLRGNFYN